MIKRFKIIIRTYIFILHIRYLHWIAVRRYKQNIKILDRFAGIAKKTDILLQEEKKTLYK